MKTVDEKIAKTITMKIQKLEQAYTIISKATKLPYLDQDEETADDQVHFFDNKEEAENAAKRLNDNNDEAEVLALDKKTIMGIFTECYLIGANRIVFHEGLSVYAVLLNSVVKVKVNENPEGQPPAKNPLLMCTMIYFMQELKKAQKAGTIQNNPLLKEKEDELWANLKRSSFIQPILVDEDNKDENGNPKINVVMVKSNNNDKQFQILFTDLKEARKFLGIQKQPVKLMTMPFDKLLSAIVGPSEGYIVDPASVSLTLLKKVLEVKSK